MYAYIRIYTYAYMLNKNTWGVKKVRGQEEPETKSSDIKKSVNESAAKTSNISGQEVYS